MNACRALQNLPELLFVITIVIQQDEERNLTSEIWNKGEPLLDQISVIHEYVSYIRVGQDVDEVADDGPVTVKLDLLTAAADHHVPGIMF